MTYLSLYEWFDHNGRSLPWRETRDPYAIWISEIILQQTRVEQGIDYYYRFLEAFPTVEDLAAASEESVLRLWQGLGYYTRARNLHKAARQIVTNTNAQSLVPHQAAQTPGLVPHQFPSTFEGIRALPGIGDYTAGAIASFAFNLPYPALDGNVYRVLSRLTNCAIPFDTTAGKKHFHAVAEQLMDRNNPRRFNAAIMELGALHCVPRHPDCEHCPLMTDCLAYRQGTVEYLPIRKARPQLTDRYFDYYIYLAPATAPLQEAWTIIQQRTARDIWHHLYQFPLIESSTPTPANTQQQPYNGTPDTQSPEKDNPDSQHPDNPDTRTPGILESRSPENDTPHPFLSLTHTLSHQRLHARFYLCRVDALPESLGLKVRFSDLDDYPFPRLILNALDHINS